MLNYMNILVTNLQSILTLIEVINPLILVITLDLQRTIDHIFKSNGFAVYPRVTVIEFEHIDTFLHHIYAVFQKS